MNLCFGFEIDLRGGRGVFLFQLFKLSIIWGHTKQPLSLHSVIGTRDVLNARNKTKPKLVSY